MCLSILKKQPNPANSLCRNESKRWQIAIASSDGVRVDQHFGSSRGFYFFEVEAEGWKETGHLLLHPNHNASHETRLNPLMTALKGCRMVYCTQVGHGAVERLLREGIQPMPVAVNSPVIELLRQVQTLLGKPEECRGHRAAKASRGTGCEHFQHLLDTEAWSVP
ncbi:MAG: hypothetical protein HQL56_15700 [Magnetococcales bacterium]|nr:hypothetical protein [Magnetococcales bacterium]